MTEGEGGMHVRAGAVGADYAGHCVDTCDAFSYLLRLSLIQPQVLRVHPAAARLTLVR